VGGSGAFPNGTKVTVGGCVGTVIGRDPSDGGVIMVAVSDAPAPVMARESALCLTTLEKKDIVLIIGGELLDLTAQLIGIDGTDAILKMDGSLDIRIIGLHHCAAFNPEWALMIPPPPSPVVIADDDDWEHYNPAQYK
jgi:hypothetical protein